MPSPAPQRERTPTEILATPAVYVRNVGPKRAELLAKLGIYTVRDLLFYFPRDYQDLSDLRQIGQLNDEKVQTVRGRVEEIDGYTTREGRHMLGVLISNRGEYLRAMWFGQEFMREKFKLGQQVQFSAKPRMRGGRWEMAHPRVTWLDDEEQVPENELLAVYPLTEGLSQYHMRRMIATAVEDYSHVPDEVFSESLLREFHLLPLAEALPAIHVPRDAEQLAAARRRFVFQELFVLQLAISARRFQQQVGFRAPELPATAQIDARIRRLFPFELTPDQQKVIDEVAADMALDRPMNRLLQGDVGSGKTAVALYAMLLCVANGYQAALMAPTEILARQHARTLQSLLEASRVRHRLLVGGLPDAERQQVLADLAAGKIDVVIGTHAIIQDQVEFAKLGLVVIDEQHKFGVRQRAALRRGDTAPHYLVMTATPIPRTVSMTLFGDLDISILRDMPPGRQPVSTYLVEPDQRMKWWDFVRNKLHEGRQVFVVVPLVEESENVSAVSVNQAYERLTNGVLAEFRVGLVHGRMTPAEKEKAMADFRDRTTQVLVSTTVIEVGVDIPNASVMVIASPERFGLAQMHQIRGRVGRGSHPGYCGVILTSGMTDEVQERLKAFASTTNGFELAELDFQMRGPGDLFGTQQHGLPPLRIAHLQRDHDVLIEARAEAQRLYSLDPGLKLPENARLRRQMIGRYGEVLALSDVG
jgi:ATP-dependent DNA helicase RecG